MHRFCAPVVLSLLCIASLLHAAESLPPYAAEIAAAAAHLRLHEPAEAQGWLAQVPPEEREWEWDLLAARSNHAIDRWSGFDATVLDIALQPGVPYDQVPMIALAFGDGEVWLVHSGTGTQERRFIGHSDGVYTVAWNPEGTKLVTASRDKSVRVWDAETGQQLAEYRGHANAVSSACWSIDGSEIASASWYRDPEAACVVGEVHRINPRADRGIHRIGYPMVAGQAPMSTVAYSPDGLTIAAGSWSGSAYLFDAKTGEQLREFALPEESEIYNAVDAMVFAPTGAWLATAGRDHDVRIWDTGSARLITTLEEPTGPTWSLAVSGDGGLFAAAGADEQVYLYASDTWIPLATYAGHTKTVRSLEFSAGRELLWSGSADQTVGIWDTNLPPKVDVTLPHQPSAGSVRFLPEDELLLTCDFDGNASVWVPALEHMRLQWTADREGINLAALSADGTQVATCNWAGHVTLWEIDPMLEGATLIAEKDQEGGTSYLAFSPDSHELAIGGMNGKLIRLALPSLQTVIECPAPSDVLAVAWHPESRHIAGALSDGQIAIWNDERGTPYLIHAQSHSVAFSPDGRWLASGGESGVTCLDWAQEYDVWRRWTTASDSPVNRVVWHPDGKRLAVASMSVQILEAETGTVLLTEAMPSMVWDVAFSANGVRLAACTSEGVIRTWDSMSTADRYYLSQLPTSADE